MSTTEDTLGKRTKHTIPSHEPSLLPTGLPLTSSGNELKERNKRIWRQIWCTPLMIFLFIWATIFYSAFLYLGYQRAEIYRSMTARVEIGVASYYYNWFFDRPIDVSDGQWSSLRSFLPSLFLGATIFVLLRRLISRFLKNPIFTKFYYMAFSIGFLLFLHNRASIFPIFFAICSYCIGKFFKHDPKNPLLSWLFNGSVRVCSDFFGGFSFTLLFFWDPYTGYIWDTMRGVLTWQTYYNILLCRLISFNCDYYEFCKKQSQQQSMANTTLPTPPKVFTASFSEHRFRQEQFVRKESDYNFVNFFIYVFYVPLYIGGPICGYNAFVSYLEDAKQTEYNWKQIFVHIIRLLFYILMLELFLHFNYSVAFAQRDLWNNFETDEFPRMTSYEVAAVGLALITFTYLKFLIIWRFFRLWALADGVNPPENMNRCLFNNYSLSMFWRSWHRSLYIWIVTYLYKPLGGSQHKLRNAIVIFFFIAVWHDLWMRWISWAFFNLFVMALEIAVTQFFAQKKMQWIKEQSWYTAAFCFVMPISHILIILSNLGLFFGFARSYDFIQIVFFNGWESVLTIVIIFLFFPVGIRMGIAQREYEAAVVVEKTNY